MRLFLQYVYMHTAPIWKISVKSQSGSRELSYETKIIELVKLYFLKKLLAGTAHVTRPAKLLGPFGFVLRIYKISKNQRKRQFALYVLNEDLLIVFFADFYETLWCCYAMQTAHLWIVLLYKAWCTFGTSTLNSSFKDWSILRRNTGSNQYYRRRCLKIAERTVSPSHIERRTHQERYFGHLLMYQAHSSATHSRQGKLSWFRLFVVYSK